MKREPKKIYNSTVPIIVPLALLVLLIGVFSAVITQRPMKIVNINNQTETYEKGKGTIKFEQETYECTEGERFETMIRATAPKNSREAAKIKSYGTSDKEVATMDEDVVNQVNCVDCRVVRVFCHKAGSIQLNAESSLGATTTAELVVKQREGTISYAKANYSCTAGETFETMIRTTNGLGIKSYKSSNEKIATVDANTKMQTNCIDCRLVRVVCKKAGKVTLSATASNGATTTSGVTVTANKGTIKFKENSYTCNAGETFETMITVSGGATGNTIKSYKSSDESIATIDDNTTYQVNCIDCRLVRVVCRKKGNVTLSATSTSGAETSVSLSVKQDIGTIKFDKASYTCNAGETFQTIIRVTSTDSKATIKSYGTSDESVATIDDNTTYQVDCIDCKAVRVVCKKKGSVTLNAESSTGAKTTSSLTVNENKGTIKFDKSSYSCSEGEIFETMITVSGGAYNNHVKSYKSSDESIATIDSNTTYQVNCINCRLVRIVCKKKGSVSLTATSSSGATTSVNLKVNEKIGTTSYDKASYTCNAGETFETMIRINGAPIGTYVKSYGSNNESVATVDANTSVQVNCIDCRLVRVVCKKKGSVILNATASSGAKTTSSLTVK